VSHILVSSRPGDGMGMDVKAEVRSYVYPCVHAQLTYTHCTCTYILTSQDNAAKKRNIEDKTVATSTGSSTTSRCDPAIALITITTSSTLQVLSWVLSSSSSSSSSPPLATPYGWVGLV
jgi:hypothetical protein